MILLFDIYFPSSLSKYVQIATTIIATAQSVYYSTLDWFLPLKCKNAVIINRITPNAMIK